jgi:phage-related protein
MVFGLLKNLTELIILGILLILVTLFLLYMILNINNKMDEFVKIYEQEQKQQYSNLQNDFQKIDEQNNIIKEILDSTQNDLPLNIEEINNLKTTFENIESGINSNTKALEIIKNNIEFDDSSNLIIKSKDNEQSIYIGSDTIRFNIIGNKMQICDNVGSGCSSIVHYDNDNQLEITGFSDPTGSSDSNSF